MSMKNVTGLPGQTAFDIAIKQYGAVEGIRFLLEDNTISNQFVVVPETLQGLTISIRENQIINQRVTSYYGGKPVVSY
ncbi:MAG TPA: hypothetical protein PKD70_06220 [Saprospiraceae bacterium]|nr:hypothetical protein [Saprospiraceae bacterium]HMP13453.1 hypothetical protein [Saprospiraceae bacterium]